MFSRFLLCLYSFSKAFEAIKCYWKKILSDEVKISDHRFIDPQKLQYG